MNRMMLAFLLAFSMIGISVAEDAAKPLTTEEAAKKIDQKVVVEFEVKSASLRNGVLFLNSMEDHKDAKNFTVFVDKAGVEKLKTAKIDDPVKHFKGKVVTVTGTVTNFKEKPQIKVSDAESIKLVEKK